ncbi:hypothetical protein SODALDRAFT_60344 [Sodiomyces alkalinus F11]|uniref:Uncharacterized protein n=1 Tax=Sodiomyces alkalinus (strain CBS 110278 / VKM F-3762 / F11) TaxID=1314773 RepID=A0A3N2PLJ7_SODAK|nr:hypothetical protein SODALDRAFT_60344 [Sodiomyces alkalinus F11]ROT35274.1 hypothetical protein SODALDRAFT_60344 [Sodiomyces alkalinus F11]
MCFIATQAPVTGSAPRPEDEETRPKFSVHNDHTAFSHALLHAGLYGILGDGLSAKDESIFWTRYQPPHVVKDNRDVTDPILLEIITSSIVNIKARIFECYRRRPTLFREVAAAAWLGVAEEEAARYDGQEDDAIEEDTESCIPIIVPPESSSKRKRTRGSIYRPLPIDECGYRRSSLPVDAAYHAVVARISDKLRGTALATGEPHLIPEPGPEPGPGPGPEPEPEPMEQV